MSESKLQQLQEDNQRLLAVLGKILEKGWPWEGNPAMSADAPLKQQRIYPETEFCFAMIDAFNLVRELETRNLSE